MLKKTVIKAYADYFYPYDTIPKIYVYRDVVGGLNEQFHRVYGVKDEVENTLSLNCILLTLD